MFKGSPYYKLTLLALITMATSSVGIIQNVSGIFFLPMSLDLNTGIASLSLSLTLSSLATGFAGPFMMKFMVKKNFVYIMRLGVLITALSTILIALSSNLILIYVLSIIRGIATSSFSLAPIMYLIGNWFEEKQGFVTGLVMSFTGITGVILNPLVNKIILLSNWRYALAFTGLFLFFITFVGSFWLKPHPEDRGLSAYGAKDKEKNITHQKNLNLNVNFFFIILAIYALLTSSLSSMIQHFPNYSITISQTTSVGAIMVSFAMFGNLLFKFVLGSLSDKIGIIKANFVILAIYLFSQLSFNFLPLENSYVLLIFMSFLMGSIYSAVAVGLPLLTKYFYSKEESNIVYASITALISMGSSIGIVLMGVIYDVTGSYQIGYLSLMMVEIITILLLIILIKSRHS